MKVSEDFKTYTKNIRVGMEGVEQGDIAEIASMVRGLMCSIEGWAAIAGLTNDVFENRDPLILNFSSIENAKYFKSCVEYYFSDDILQKLKVKRRVKK
jgi:hypothetical protein